MPTATNQPIMTSDSKDTRPRTGRVRSIAVALISTAVVAGCGGAPTARHVAKLPSAGSSSPSSASGARAGALAYSQCMRAQGIGEFPDPNAAGELALHSQPGSGIDPDNPKFKAALKACEQLLPASTGKKPARADSLKYSQCMRAHKISDFPDPQADGTLQVQGGGPGTDIDPSNPQFMAANKACEHFLPGVFGGGGGTNSSNGQ